MKIKVIRIKEFKVGDKVEFTKKVKDFYLKMSKDESKIEDYGVELLEKMISKHNRIHTIDSITENLGDGRPQIWLDDMIGSSMISQLKLV